MKRWMKIGVVLLVLNEIRGVIFVAGFLSTRGLNWPLT